MKNAKIASLLFVLSAGSMMFAQDDLINKLKNKQSECSFILRNIPV